MTDTFKTRSRVALRATLYVLLVSAALSFLWGGRALSEFIGVERLIGEVEGVGAAVVFGILGGMAKAAAGSKEL